MDPVAWTMIILAAAVVAFVTNRVPIVVVAFGVALSLWATGVLTLNQSLAGFGDPTVLFIASLFVVGEALDTTGVTAWAGQQVIGRAGRSPVRLLVVVSALAAVMSALISVNGATAALLPLVVVVAARAGLVSSKMLIPLAFAASAGSMLALTGTPVNIIVSDAAEAAGERPFGYFEFALVGIPLVAGTILIMVLLRNVLPERHPQSMARDLGDYAATIKRHYDLRTEAIELPLIGAAHGAMEVIVSPRSSLIGARVFPGMTMPDGDLVVLAVRRGADDLGTTEETLRAGDTLLLRGGWRELRDLSRGPDLVVVDAPDLIRRTVALGTGAKRAIGILAGMVLVLATGLIPAAAAGLLAAGAAILLKVVSVPQAFRSISWTTVVLVAGMIPLATAFTETGAADMVANGVLALVGDSGPQLALLVLCVLTFVMSQLISNAATVLVVIPIATSIATTYDVSVLPFMMALTVAGAAAFLTPVATPANAMVLEPGGYKFGDYWRLGLPLSVFFVAMAVLYVPLIWRF
ncbi:SLC13 family permease [Agromyces sp. SYSU T00194]|uniref:SLC13 family permease n=1 Tax=Agromyces chitinivorans TaxID=3158560 RepID=UPI00339B94AE